MTEFKFDCPECHQHIAGDTSYAGMQINCPHCQQGIVVPPAPAALTHPPPTVTMRPRPVPPSQPAVSPQTRAPSRSNFQKNLGIAVVALTVVACLAAAWFYFWQATAHPPGLVAAWSGAGKGKDAVGGNRAKMTDITIAADARGQVFSFNGTSSSIRIPAAPVLEVGAAGGFTVMTWIKPAAVDGLHPILQWANDNALNLWIGIRPSENGVLRGDFSDADGNHFVCSHPGTLISGAFQHIAFTYDKTAGVGTLYLNGVVVAQRQVGSQRVVNTTGDLWLSPIDRRPGNWSTGRAFKGLLDGIALYKRALSAVEIGAICAKENHGEALVLPAASTGWVENWMR